MYNAFYIDKLFTFLIFWIYVHMFKWSVFYPFRTGLPCFALRSSMSEETSFISFMGSNLFEIRFGCDLLYSRVRLENLPRWEWGWPVFVSWFWLFILYVLLVYWLVKLLLNLNCIEVSNMHIGYQALVNFIDSLSAGKSSKEWD